MTAHTPLQSDVVILGAGIIGLALALELADRGARVSVVESRVAFGEASSAAAGMLAAHDPHNPPGLLQLAELSVGLYPAFLERVERLSGLAVPFQTDTTLQYLDVGECVRLSEHSIDPRQLGAALTAAIRGTSVMLVEEAGAVDTAASGAGFNVQTAAGFEVEAGHVVQANGAWFAGRAIVKPRKGQMLRVGLPGGLATVHRSEHVYVVPRTQGPQAGTALIGATVEDAGFDTAVDPRDLARLRAMAAALLPALADEAATPQVEAWAGLRPSTVDGLPVLGALSEREWVATGHFRNGILLAPATAQALADLIENKTPQADLAGFSVQRFPARD